MATKTASPVEQAGALALGIPGFTYPDLYRPARLADLGRHFDAYLDDQAPQIGARFRAYHAGLGAGMTPEEISAVLVDTAPLVGAFIARLFGIEDAWETQRRFIRDEDETVLRFRTEILAGLGKRFKSAEAASWDRVSIKARVAALRDAFRHTAQRAQDDEYVTASAAVTLATLAAAAPDAEPFEALHTLRSRLAGQTQLFPELMSDAATFVAACREPLEQWCYLAQTEAEFAPEIAGWVSFKQPARTDVQHLVHGTANDHGAYQTIVAPPARRRRRDGFALTDRRFNERQVLYEVDHCIYCHDRDADSCSKGMRHKKDNSFKVNALGVTVTGCPLEEKISEMHVVKRQGDNIGALALIIIDNPMCPGTGHRICNDCMKGCIYQKTEPVNIPQIETSVLTDVLFLPWGFEIYGLLTRWNPLNVKRPHALPYNSKKVLVVGLGPAGYTLSHYLLNEGFGVVGIDALKLEPLPVELTGSATTAPRPVRDFSTLYDELDQRTVLGFGGVAEYGITVRWDKNFLKVIYLTLLRRQGFRAYGGVRFGGTLTIEEVWERGFDHIALATGAGKPSIIALKNNLIRGIRKASDFLMSLQLTGAAKDSSLANLQMRLPVGVIGGGLTAIDTCTEAMAYYPKQVEKFLDRYEHLVAVVGEERMRARYDREELGIMEEFLAHGRAIRAERARAAAAGEVPDFAPLVAGWGGVTLFYRKELKDAPAYRQNYEEINEALTEGIDIAGGMNPVEALPDEYGALRAVRFEHAAGATKTQIEVPLKSLFVAAGTSPNTIYQQEHPDTFELDDKFFRRFEPSFTANGFTLEPVPEPPAPKLGPPAPFTSYQRDGKYITFYGDNHPVWAGNVVKAMASAKSGYPYVVALFAAELSRLSPDGQAARDGELARFFAMLDYDLIATIVAVHRLTPSILEVIVHAPMSAQKFEPGQFYRVQNIESLASRVEGTVLASEGLALTGAWVDKAKGLVSLIALEMGTSSRLMARWQPGARLVVMGVTGAPTEIPHGRTVLLIGGGLGNAVLFSIGKALRAAGNQVIYFAGYKRPQDVFKVEEIEAASDVVVWAVDPGPEVKPIPTARPQDCTFVGNVVEAMRVYSEGELGPVTIPLSQVDELIVIGSDAMMAAVKAARKTILAPYLKPGHRAIGSINSPMQCMMKGVCAQCLCKHVDPETGAESFVYSCYNQDQALDWVDFDNLRARLRQNSVQEKLGGMWLDYLLDHHRAA